MPQVGRPSFVKCRPGVQCGTEKLDTWQLWGTYILYMNYVSILVLRVYCRCGFLVSSRGETEFHVFFVCFVHLFRSFSKFVGSNELRFIYNDFQERSKINALTIQQRNMTMENHGLCVISFNMMQWFLISMLNMCISQPFFCHRKHDHHDRLSWVISMTSSWKPFEPVGDSWQFDQTTTGPETYFQSVSRIHLDSQSQPSPMDYVYIHIIILIIIQQYK